MEPLTDDDTRTLDDLLLKEREEHPELDDEEDIRFLVIWGKHIFQQEYRP